MGDLIRGETFAAGETVTAARLHKLVEDAEIKAGSVGTTELADGAVTTAKLANAATLQAAQVTLANGKMLVGDGSNVGIATTVDSATLQTSPTIAVKDGGIATAKIADLGVTGAKLENLSPSPAGTYGSATEVPVVVVDAKGRVTGVSEVAIVGLVEKNETTVLSASIPAAGATYSTGHGLTGLPDKCEVFLVFKGSHLGRAAGDQVSIESVASGTNGDDQAFVVDFNTTNVFITRDGQATSPALLPRGGSWGTGSELTLTNCDLRIVAWRRL